MEQPKITGIHLRISHDDTYERAFDEAYKKLKANDIYENKIPFAFLGIAYLEYCLNLTLIDYFNNEFSKEYSEKYASYYLRGLPLKAKVELLPSILSQNHLVSDSQSEVIQAVSLFIGIRNKVTHHADFYQAVENSYDADGAALFTFSTADENLNRLSGSNIDRVYKAIKDYVAGVHKQYAATKRVMENNFIKRVK